MTNFHPAVTQWFRKRFGEASEPQKQGWPLIQQGKHVLISAPTGSGKTLAAFLCALDSLVRQGLRNEISDTTSVLYISPLKALANDVQKNLLEPLQQIREEAAGLGLRLPEIRPLVRSGDTPARERRQMVDRPPHILVTTPESFFILLTSESGQRILRDVRTVIVDEIHAIAGDKRGSHLALSLERLQALSPHRQQRVGLSATQKPIELVARFLCGTRRRAEIVQIGYRRSMDLAVEVPNDELSAVASREMWEEIYDRLAGLIQNHRTTLVFVNTRRLAERVTHDLERRLGKEAVATHHGSLARELRLETEERLKQGSLKVVVATASLELGIDVGSIDLVCQIGSPRSISLALQRIGRSGHWKGAVSKGRIFATTRDELLECAALAHAIRKGELDRLSVPEAPLDVLAQQIVAAAACREWKEEELYRLIRRSFTYARLSRNRFDQIVTMLSEGISTQRGRRGAYLHRDRIQGKIRARRNARLAAITSGGAIPDVANYLVKADPEEIIVGDLDEDFAVESMSGDIFLLGNTSWRIRRVEAGVVRVENAQGAPPTIPFWRGEAPGRSDELSAAFSDIREKILEIAEGASASSQGADIGNSKRTNGIDRAVRWLQEECGLDRRGALQAVQYVQAGRRALGRLPTQRRIVAERFFDESGGMQLILHSPFGSRINKAWGLALRKRFCRSFNFELQAAATENGVLISLSDQHSFPLRAVSAFLSSANAQQLLMQALFGVPLFNVRWRWNASRALAVLRFSGGRKVPPPLQRMRSDDLLASVFPEQAACLENIEGDIQVPDHPLVEETIKDCLTEALDAEGLIRIIRGLESGEVEFAAIDTPEPSPFSHEILNSNAYTFLDNAPLEERRARAAYTRRTLSSEPALGDALLDPAAVREVVKEIQPPFRDPDEVHDALLTLGVIPEEELNKQELETLQSQGRVLQLRIEPDSVTSRQDHGSIREEGRRCFWFAAERLRLVQLIWPRAEIVPRLSPQRRKLLLQLWKRDQELEAESALCELLRCQLESSGPLTVKALAERFGLSPATIETALLALEARGQILRGRFCSESLEWCDRRLLARIHRRSLGRLRREIEPVTPAGYMRFLFHWQHLVAEGRLHGEAGLFQVLEQLQGLEAPAAAWEASILSARVADYSPDLLDRLCLSGQFAWGRLSPPTTALLEADAVVPAGRRGVRPTRIAPVTFFKRSRMACFLEMKRNFQGIVSSRPEAEIRKETGQVPFLSQPAAEVLAALEQLGACFLEDLVRATGRLPIQVEEGLWELVSVGLVTADGFDNLRSLIEPRRRLRTRRHPFSEKRAPFKAAMGRWTLLQPPLTTDLSPAPRNSNKVSSHQEKPAEFFANVLLKRWGIVCRDILARETLAPAWRELLLIYRQMEARGELRGGRFVSGLVGEQFALPEAVDTLRSIRRQSAFQESLSLSAADPLNLIGIILPGGRIRPHPETRLHFRKGALISELPECLSQSASIKSQASNLS